MKSVLPRTRSPVLATCKDRFGLALTTGVLCTLASSVHVSPALACGLTPPSVTVLTTEEGAVFAGGHTLQLYQYGFSFELARTRVTLDERTDAGVTTRIPATLRATAADWLYELDLGEHVLTAGSHYTLDFEVERDERWLGFEEPLTFEAVAAPPEPSSLGRLALAAQHRGALHYGGCGDSVDGAQAIVRLDATEQAAPWARAAHHELLVDGASAVEPGLPMVDYVEHEKGLLVRAIALCGDASLGIEGAEDAVGADPRAIEVELAPGVHRLVWRTHFPSGASLQSEPLEIDLRCEVPASDASSPPPSSDEDDHDAGASDDDGRAARTKPAASADGESDGDTEPAPANGSANTEMASAGCTISARGSSAPGATAWLTLLGLLALRARRDR